VRRWGRFIDLVGVYGRGNGWGRVWCEEEEEGCILALRNGTRQPARGAVRGNTLIGALLGSESGCKAPSKGQHRGSSNIVGYSFFGGALPPFFYKKRINKSCFPSWADNPSYLTVGAMCYFRTNPHHHSLAHTKSFL
jgi:hypothetical protein